LKLNLILMKSVYFGLTLLMLICSSCKQGNDDPKTEIRHGQLMMVFEDLETFLAPMEGLEKKIRKQRHATQDPVRKEKFLKINKELDLRISEIKAWKANYSKPLSLSNKKQVEYMISKQREIEQLRKDVEDTIGKAARIISYR